jgi:PadR family transcriptional regulator PadR
LRTEDLKRTILKMFRGSELYGYEVNRRLALQGVEIELSRLYRVLNDMQKKGLLNDRWEKSRFGPRKKMYSVSEKGKEELNEILLEAIATVHGFYGEYLQSLYPRVNVVGDLVGSLTEGLEGNEKIVYLTTKYFGIHELLVTKLQEKIPEGTVYVVKPSALDININLENVNIMDGSYDDMPFKNGFIDRLMVVDLPNRNILDKSASEWQRVINQKGKVAIITPTILVQKHDDPLTIGDFVEKHEHQIIEKGEHVDREFLLSTLGSLFQRVVETEAVHMSTIFAYEPRAHR